MVRRLLTETGHDELVEQAQLLVSEVVTNALVHSGTSIDVSMAIAEGGVLVEVGDGSDHIPSRRDYAPTASTGRGLALLEQTADAWGVVRRVRGKTVWFTLSGAAGGDEPGNGSRPESVGAAALESGDRGDTVTVELVNVPLLLHAAWQQHVEAMLREFLLARLELDADDDVLTVHAEATDALAVLAEHIPRPDIGVEPDEVMSTAVEPHISSPRVVVSVPTDSVPHFGVLDDVLETAFALGQDDQLLIPPVQPELRDLRRWLCGQVQHQAWGGAPAPWPPRGATLSQAPRRHVGWDSTSVTRSLEALVAADAHDRILAVSPAARRLLGYDDLVGERLIRIIPQRYRQAHLAGFTLHHLTGRGPLLDRPVVVPAQCADGSEVTVELTVRSHRVTEGQSVFVATLREVETAQGHRD
jgi:PAS domain S-box-containing protein